MCLVVALCVATLPPSLRDRPQSGQARVEVVTIVSTYTTFVGEYSYSWRADSKQKQTTNGRWPHLNTHVHTSDPHIHIRCILILYAYLPGTYVSTYVHACMYTYPEHTSHIFLPVKQFGCRSCRRLTREQTCARNS